MEGVEIVITPKTLERIAYSTVIVILLVLLVINWGGESCAPADNQMTGNVVAEPESTPEQTPKVTLADVAPTAVPAPGITSTCTNNVKDPSETDIDCGGDCEGCGEYKACNTDKDCASEFYCYQHIKCMKATCDDGIKNQDETNIDCGGACTETRGSFFWTIDNKCHLTKEPSGRLEIEVSADTGESSISHYAVINNVTLNVKNGLSKNVALTAFIYALTPTGKSAKPDMEGNNKVIASAVLNSLAPGDELKKVVNLNGTNLNTLQEIDPEDAYQIQVDFKDGENSLVDRVIWTNN